MGDLQVATTGGICVAAGVSARGFFEIDRRGDSLADRRSSEKISMDVHISAHMYDRILDALNRRREFLQCLEFSAHYVMRDETQDTKYRWFEVSRFEVAESVEIAESE